LPKRGSAWLSTRDTVHFNQADSKEQWFIIGGRQQILFTADGGGTFIDCDKKLTQQLAAHVQDVYISSLFYDAPRNVLYLGLCAITKSPKSVGLSPLYRSFDKGASFEPFDIGVNNITSMTVTANGNLVAGTICDSELPGQLIVLEGAEPAKKEVKCTVGDTVEEQSLAQVLFNNISSDGNDVIAVASYQGGVSRHIAQGPLLSTDGGKTFRWIRYNLPGTSYGCAAIGHGIIIMDDSSNNCVYQYKESEFKVPGESKGGSK
jgi:hypothetical protein